MSMDYSGFEKLLEGFKQVQKQHETFIRNFLMKEGLKCLGQTVRLTPEDEGILRERWELSKVFRRGDELYIVLFNPMEYASFVEDGHWQERRPLALEHLDKGGVKSKALAASIRATYGSDAKYIMLKEKWIPGHHMARISITKIQRTLPARYEQAFKKFMKDLGVG